MKMVTLSVLLAAGAALAGAAHAQDAPSAGADFYAPAATSGSLPIDPGVGGDAWRLLPDRAPASYSASMRFGVGALKAQDYVEAEEIFASVLDDRPFNADANFYMGVTGMKLGKWVEAKKHLEIAARKKPGHPDPKSRLGVTYAKLGDIEAASAQRAALVKMNDTCTDACRRDFASHILAGIRMIDAALAESVPAGSEARG